MHSHLLDARYRILAVLNTGELTQTYLVEDTNLPNSQFILKQLQPANKNSQDIKILRRFFTREAATLEKLGQKHDQIQQLVSYFEESEDFYLVQEFIPGKPLTEEILLGIPLEEEQVINLLTEILEILVFIHSHDISHQDIKPANIIRRESDNKLVLIDFGSIKEIVANIVGNLEYIPIEQLQGNTQPNSDIYALGIIAIASLIGLTENEIDILPKHKNLLTGEIIWRDKIPQVNKDLARIIDKMVRFDYRKRYQSASEVLNDLKQLNQDGKQQPVQKPWLILAGIVSLVTVGIAAWFSLMPKPVGDSKLIYLQGVEKYERGDYKKAVEDLTKVITLNPRNSQAYNRRGDAFYRLGDYQKAQADSSKAIQLNRRDDNAYYDRGFSFYELGKYKQAIADFNQAIKLNAKNPYSYYGRGLARVELKDYSAAITDFSKAIAFHPKYSEAYLQRGIVRRRLKIKEAAIQDFDTVIEINPHDAKAYYQRGLTLFANNQSQAAIQDYNSAIEINPKYLEAYLSRGDVYSDMGKNLEATEDYNKVIELNPKLAVAYLHRGMHRFSLGNYQGAIIDYNQAIQLEPKNAVAYNNRGNAYLEWGNKKVALANYTKAIAVNSRYALAYYNRGLLRAKLGEQKGAIADFQQAAKLFQQKGDQDAYKDAQSQLKGLEATSDNENKATKQEKN
ncbi:tetratricopeptide repeat protein [Tolypothrix sp. PCC 7910]|uniref:serine/threonine-protein kinase n=1 Tax=Tolypothrix sp. PCC 7910 TaxID=2099387 RepID=UPI00142797BB|nr:serine/threonine-protein kinase [Tolypothrix sp. PCC 7910]QIR41039.1 tetratricopeptide repeat protein [Tolypothrix sp. PCC 7910]